ncbi:hypothetical protein [Streptomyces sp. NPDC020951]|uniref:hypothetical protein n=1 Tax=Streptomyces sp. NPDC020951 TaxID=3365104 RepID=UPI0037AB3A67
MPKMVLLAQHLTLNGNDLKNFTKKAELSVEVEDKDITTYASLGWKEVLGGLKSGELGIDFLQDFAVSQLDAIMWPLLGTVVPFVVRADQGAVSTSNPSYSGNVLIKGWNPIEGSVGDEATVGVTYPTSGIVSRTTA